MLAQNKGLGIQVGVVVNNIDLEKMHRVLVEFPVDSHGVKQKVGGVGSSHRWQVLIGVLSLFQ